MEGLRRAWQSKLEGRERTGGPCVLSQGIKS